MILRAVLLMALAAGPAWAAQAPPSPTPENPHDATAHHPFTGIEKWTKIFDDPKRDEWQKPKETVAGLDLKPGSIVADLGAGTGYFERHLSKAVAPGGIVLAVDTEPEMVQHLGRRALQEQTPNVVPVLALPDEPFLPPGRVDCVLIVDTYHHIDDRVNYFRRMKEALAPGGRLAVVDFHKRELPVGPPVQHKLAREFVVDELGQAGWSLAGEKAFLPYQYFLIFRPAPR
ncbi:MAG: class I SAM-dependent methyltransferase [Acidobacteria bacterium]|nr:class I SAM-dependent methyltransferase [Acidobacteriota bacterium]